MKLFFHTVKYLKPMQVFGRVWFRFYRPRVQAFGLGRRAVTGPWMMPCEKVASFFGGAEFRFLNHTRTCLFPGDWNNPEWDKLWLYNLHYFDDLQAAEADRKQDWHKRLITAWIKGNPPGQGNGWEPYPTSLRIVNWIKWILAGHDPSFEMLESLAAQAGFLRKRLEIHLLGNHLFANAKALVFAGLFFYDNEAEQWLNKGLKILAREVPEQVLPDGGHFERSPMYHAVILEDLLDLINMMHAYGHPVPENWPAKVAAMLSWLAGMCHPDGQIALFNDAAFGIAPFPLDLYDYSRRLGLTPSNQTQKEVLHLKESGYIKVRKGPVEAFLDVGPIGPDYLPGHAHADTLSFELSLFEKRFIVDSGTSCYGTSPERLRQRGTKAHNTVTIDDKNSSEVWGGFRVARRAYPSRVKIAEDSNEICIACSHDGYSRLPGKPIHHREWRFDKRHLMVKDFIDGQFDKAAARFHFHPEVKIDFHSSQEGAAILLTGQRINWHVLNGEGAIYPASWHPEFGVTLKSTCLQINFINHETQIIFNWA